VSRRLQRRHRARPDLQTKRPVGKRGTLKARTYSSDWKHVFTFTD
jgi:hypothetical protein